MSAAIDESKSHNVRVAVHATELDTAKAAVRAGADILVHSVSDRLVDTEFINLVKNRDVLYITTLAVEDGYRMVLDRQVALTDIEQKLGDPEVIATWSELAKIPPGEIPGGIPHIPAPPKRLLLARRNPTPRRPDSVCFAVDGKWYITYLMGNT